MLWEAFQNYSKRDKKKLNVVSEVVINSVIQCGARNSFSLKTGIVELEFFVTNRADLVTGQFFSKRLKNQDCLLSKNVKVSTSSEEDPVFFLHMFLYKILVNGLTLTT